MRKFRNLGIGLCENKQQMRDDDENGFFHNIGFIFWLSFVSFMVNWQYNTNFLVNLQIKLDLIILVSLYVFNIQYFYIVGKKPCRLRISDVVLTAIMDGSDSEAR